MFHASVPLSIVHPFNKYIGMSGMCQDLYFSEYVSITYKAAQPTYPNALLYTLSMYTLYSMASHAVITQIE